MEAPMSVWLAMSLPMDCDPGAMAAPTNAITVQTTSRLFLAWNKSEADDKMLQNTACTRIIQFGTHDADATPLRSCDMMPS